tara:strand:- start:303 stop:593 length:291 start_codon:yes stop_codon:yes gene_type:complete
MKLLSVTSSEKPEKKMKAVFETDSGRTKTIHFGAKGMDDYTITKDKEQRARYIKRHSANENFNKPDTAGALAKHILWGESTSKQANIASFKKKFNL